jgi:hypothetical protein
VPSTMPRRLPATERSWQGHGKPPVQRTADFHAASPPSDVSLRGSGRSVTSGRGRDGTGVGGSPAWSGRPVRPRGCGRSPFPATRTSDTTGRVRGPPSSGLPLSGPLVPCTACTSPLACAGWPLAPAVAAPRCGRASSSCVSAGPTPRDPSSPEPATPPLATTSVMLPRFGTPGHRCARTALA